MSVEIKGIEGVTDKVHQDIQNLISKTETESLLNGAEVVKSAIIKEFGKFKDTGASIDEIKISKPVKSNGKSKVILYWGGPQKRYKIIHLNEYGYTKHGKKKASKIKPRGFGAIQRALLLSRNNYKDTVSNGFRSNIK
ncbi:hypothetical protein MI410_09610 [Staphylococcus epidermidis]|uniref:hypothetical protein n=1 Tax=Staphylococcus epidermidis TaxID=1282 RepID=UPI0013711F8B|nr:hypothetical protein [Staphylococcus epidermidis]MCG7838101.1 hypothetical protein [Staphylococcus epidermidis]MCG7843428.1 hypothetical protein [Staphylococcus epidermidis]MDK8622928.1 hypothetical protein [Staphylococcus epidermidis]NAM80322.1 hypothetical protein [Staphylococcus epidermidis]